MAGLNKVQLIGRLGRDPESRSFQNGGKIVTLRLATSDTWRDKQTGERKERTEWHTVVIHNEAVGKIAEQYLRKGSEVYVEGKLETRKWQDQSGADRYSTEVTIRPYGGEIVLLGGRNSGDGEGGGGRRDDRDDDRRDDRGGGGSSGRGGSGGGGRPDIDDETPF